MIKSIKRFNYAFYLSKGLEQKTTNYRYLIFFDKEKNQASFLVSLVKKFMVDKDKKYFSKIDINNDVGEKMITLEKAV